MSFSFNVKKVDGALVLEASEYVAANLPDGAVLNVYGHYPAEGTSAFGTIGVSLSVVRGDAGLHEQLVSANAGYNARPTPPAPVEPAAEPDGEG